MLSLSAVTRRDIERLRDIMQEKCFEYGAFTLSSGLPSSYYYDGKRVTLHPRWAPLIGRSLLAFVLDSGAEAVGGMALGAIPIAQAVSLSALELANQEIPVFIVRQSRKEHGTKDEVAAAFAEESASVLRPGTKVAIVDDVVTTGGSVERAVAAVEGLGCQVAAIVALVERHEGGGDALSKRGYDFHRLFYTNPDGKLLIDESVLERYPEVPSARVLP